MATNLNISENQERVPLTVGTNNALRSITPDDGSPYYVGARAYVTQTAGGAIVTVIDKDGTTTATILNGTNGQNGVSISDISLTGSSGLVDTYTITYSNGDTDTFTVTNGQDGADGNDGYSPTATVTKSGDTATITITDINGTTTATVKDGTQANAFTAEFGTTTYADVKDAYDDDAILICTVDDSGNTVVLQLVYFDATNEIFYFAEPNGDGWYWTELSNANGWDDGTRYLASTDVATQLRDGLMTALDKQKLDGIASGAEVNVQSDWNQSVNTEDDFIKNKPTIPTKVSDLSNDSGFITSPNVVYCTCSTASGTAAKVATVESGSLASLNKGDQAIVKFTNANGVASPTLQVGTTTAKSIKRYGTTAPSTSAGTSWNAGSAILFVYDGTYWQMIGYLNTTYSEISSANITNGSGSSTGLVTGRRAKAAVEAFAPVKSVNGSTGAVTVTEGLEPLVGTTATVTPQQVMTALGEGRDICIEAAGSLAIIPLALKFTAFNRATDTAYSGAVADIVASQTIINNGGAWYVYTLWGGSMQGQSIPWTVNDTQMVPATRTINGYTLDQDVTIQLSDLGGVPTSRRINNKQLTNNITLYAADVYATPNLAGGTQNTVCFGDSLFGMYRGDDSAPAYAQQIAGGIVRNVGFGGCRMSVHPTHGYAEFSMWALAKAVAENDFTAQDQYASSGQDYFADQLALLKNVAWAAVEAVVIHYGTNDFQGGVALDDATHSNDYNTICGALRYSIEKLLTAYPHLKIFVSLPVFRYWTEGGVTTYSDTKKNSNDITLPEVCKALNNVAYEYGLPVIDGYNGLGVNKVNASYYYTDGTHHNGDGRKRFGRFIGRNLVSPQPAHYIGAQGDEPSYTNMLDEAGWTDGVRLSSSGADSADSGFVTSGYIPCQYLDYIYLKNVTYNSASSSASNQRICFYNSSKTFITGCISGANATAQLGKVYDSNNDLVQFQIANVGSNSAANAAYFRICAPHIGSDSIITVNEPIE